MNLLEIVQGTKQEIEIRVRVATLPFHTIYAYCPLLESEKSFHVW